jgi:Arc/MetJ-type ribon-helix-helix transcriptional regulator
MGRVKPRGRYMAISVPIKLHREITDHVKKFSYNSIADFVKVAVRKTIDLDIYNKSFYASLNKTLAEDMRKNPSEFPSPKPPNEKDILGTYERLDKIEKTLDKILKKIRQ